MAFDRKRELNEISYLLSQLPSQELYKLGELFRVYSQYKFQFVNDGGTVFQSERLQDSKMLLSVALLEFLKA